MISIIIPMYNEEEAIGGDLDAIMHTMSGSDVPWEIIVVDDGSTDASPEIVRQREGVRLIQHPYNRGTGAARTTGLQHARGDVIVMTDGDGTYPWVFGLGQRPSPNKTFAQRRRCSTG